MKHSRENDRRSREKLLPAHTRGYEMDELVLLLQALQREPLEKALYCASVDAVMEAESCSKNRAKKLLWPLVRSNVDRARGQRQWAPSRGTT